MKTIYTLFLLFSFFLANAQSNQTMLATKTSIGHANKANSSTTTKLQPAVYDYIDLIILLHITSDVADAKGNLMHTGFTTDYENYLDKNNIYPAKAETIFKVIGAVKEAGEVYFLRLQVINTDKVVYYRMLQDSDKFNKQFKVCRFN